MGRSRRAVGGKVAAKAKGPSTSLKAGASKKSASKLLAQAEAVLSDNGDLETALALAQQASAAADSLSESELVTLYEILGICSLESGQDEQAKNFFQSCSAASSVASLYLAQLADSPEEALSCYKAAVDILSQKVDITVPADPHGKAKVWDSEELENRTQITRALVGMTEVYLAALCAEEDAEERCTEYLDLALRIDGGNDINPEIHSTLANVRLSQGRKDEALAALRRGYTIWQPAIVADPDEEHPATPLIPPFPGRLMVAKHFIECEAYDEAREVLDSCAEEDDEDLDLLYTMGLLHWLAGESAGSAEEKREEYLDCCEALEKLKKIAKRNNEECDPEVLAQVEELLSKLKTEHGVTAHDVQQRNASLANGQGGDDGWEDVDDDNEAQADASMA